MAICILSSCAPPEDLPYIGPKQEVDGKEVNHTIGQYAFTNQDGQPFTHDSLRGKIHVADVFFSHCPSLCPKVMTQMIRIQEEFKDEEDFRLVSYTCDPKRDHVDRLKTYSSNIDAFAPKWQFLTGDKDTLHDIADSYFIVSFEDPNAPGGFDHSGKILLVDENLHIRSFAEGTDPKEVDKLMGDIKQLLANRK